MSAAVRTAVTEAAVRAARAVGYVGAGTMEFIADASAGLRADRVWFMEMNTRLQVEHPVTEMITGLDLVEWQFRVAAGEALPLRQDQIIVTGHAVEARLYAENPMAGFLPSTGVLEVFAAPDTVRVDSAVECGDQVTPHYDPMIAKLIAHAATREAAIAALAQACSEVAVHPVRTNAGFLVRCLETPDFIAGAMDTGLIDRELDALTAAPEPSPEALAAAGRAARAEIDARFGDASPWSGVPGFRLNAPVATGVRLFLGERPVEARMDAPFSRRAHVGGDGEIVVFEDGEAFVFRDAPPERAGDGVDGDGSLRAPMPGKVTQVLAKVGQAVIRGQGLVTLEAMKMEQTLAAPFDGVVDEIGAEPGAQVVEGALLVRLTAASGPD
jgi:acetyl/propionyl-CoA carboxylase alpha subunit